MSNNFAFGGVNTSLIFRRWDGDIRTAGGEPTSRVGGMGMSTRLRSLSGLASLLIVMTWRAASGRCGARRMRP